MAKVVITFEDKGLEGDVRVSYLGEPDFDFESDPVAMTSAQVLAAKAIKYIANIESEETHDEDLNLRPGDKYQ